MNREDLELYVSGNFDGDVAALEREVAEDPATAKLVADEARFELMLREAAAAAVFCVACDDLVRGERCDACGAATRPGGYTVERVLVSNAHGRMYVARDADGKQVALKELAFVQAPSASTIEAFEREAKFLRALEHPAIPRFVASFEEGHGVHTRYYLAQELVVGKSLDQLDEHWYSEAEIVDIARQVLSIVVYLQSLSPMVIHRDIKPANLVRRADGSIALVDFGAAYVYGATAGLTTVGTFGYMPVEQLAGIVDATTDGYALGASLLYLLTRQEPWRLQQERTTLNASAPLRAFLDKLVARDPRARFESAKDALAALDDRAALVVTPKRPRTWLRTAIVAGVAGTLSASSIGAYMHFSSTDKPELDYNALPPAIATLRISMPAGIDAELFVDDEKTATVRDGVEIEVLAGLHHLRLLAADHERCESELQLHASQVTTLECLLNPIAPEPKLDVTTPVSWTFKATPLHDLILVVGKSCGLDLVVPSHVDAKIDANLDQVPCNVALETVLESRGLWYRYDPVMKLVRIAPRRQFDAEREEAAARVPEQQPALPAGGTIELEQKHASLRDVLRRITAVPNANLVVPDHIDGKLTLSLHGVPWERAFVAVLEAHGLWYRYREEGKVLRIAPRRELDAEAEAERERERR